MKSNRPYEQLSKLDEVKKLRTPEKHKLLRKVSQKKGPPASSDTFFIPHNNTADGSGVKEF